MGTYYEGYLQRQKKKQERTAQTGGTGSYYEGYLQRQVQNGNLDLDAITKQVAGRVNTWMENHGNFLTNYNTRFGNRKGDYSDGFVADSGDYLNTVSQQARNFAIEGNAIKGILNQYGRLLNPEWVSGITKLLDDATAQQAQVRQAAAQDASFWGQFQDAGAYKKAQTYDAQSKADLNVLLQELADLEKQLEPARQIQAQIGGFNPYAYATAEEAMAAEKALKDKLSQATALWGGMDRMEKAYEDKQEYYDSAKRIQTEQAQRNADLPKLFKELEDIQKQAEAARKIQMQIGAFNPYAYATAEEAMAAEKDLKDQLAKATEKWGGMKQLEAELSEKESYYNTAKRYQDWEKLGSVKNNADFEKMSKPQSVEMLADLEAFSGYENMKPEEIATYNYHYNTGGKEKAEEYLKSITEGLNYREAEQRFEKMEGKTWAEILYGVAAGGDQFLSGMKGLWNTITGNETYIPASTTQILGGMAREDLKDNGARAFGSSLGQMAYDMLSTTTNMVPSLVVSGSVGLINPTAGAVVGAGLMGAGAAGNAYTEMINQGHSKEQARLYSTLVGASEAGLSYLLGGIGKLGGKVSGNMIGKIVDKVDDIFTKVSIKLGGKLLSEGVEEGLQEVLTPWFKEIATNIEQDVNWEEAAYSGLLGALTALATEGGSTVRSARAEAGKAGAAAPKTEKPAQLTQNEQTVVDKIVKDRVAAAEKSGQKITAGLKKEIYNQVVEEMDRGDLSTEEIEAALGGETYQKYRESKNREEALQKEYDTLGDLVESQMTAKQKQRFQELDGLLKAEKKNASRTALQSQLSREVSELVKNDRLAVSYQEKGRRGQKFQADVNQYSEKQRATVQEAIDSGILNNTNRAHEFVDLIAKISGQTGIQFHFADNAKLKESGFALEGVTVNGYVNKDGVTVNVNSAKALNSVVGHEITHVLKGEPKLYNALAEMITKFAKDKGEYDSRMKQLTKLYEGKEGYTGEDAGAKIQKELVADLVGDYLFTDKAFVEKLSTEHRNVFQKIFDEIKYLCKLATAGSKEARQLEKAKKLFQEVYREGTKNPTEEGGVRYSIETLADGKKYVRADRQVIFGNDADSWGEQVESYINGKIRNGEDVNLVAENGDILTLTADTAGKMADNHSGHGTTLTDEEFSVKANAAVHIDELAQVSTRGNTKADKGSRHGAFASGGWNYRNAYFQDFDGKYYKLQISVAQNADGNVVYNIGKIEERSLPTVYGSSAQGGAQGRKTSSTLSISSESGNVNKKISISEQAAMNDDGVLPLPWQVRGQDVALEGPELPLPQWYRESRRAETAGRTERSRVADTARDVPGEVGLPMPEDTARTDPQRELDEAYRQRIGEDPILYDPEEDEGVETTWSLLENKLKDRQDELKGNQWRKENVIKDLDKQIAAAQEKYDAKKDKESKNSQALLRKIEKLKRKKADRVAEYDKRISEIQSQIEKINQKMETVTPGAVDKLAEVYKRIDAQRDYDERVLADKFEKRKEALQKELGGKEQNTWIRDQANKLTWEMASWVKGQEASPLLKILRRYRYEWRDLRNALEDIKDGVTIQKSPAQDTVREALAMAYEDRVYELDDLDAQYQKELEKLQAEVQERKEKARIAESRKGKQQVYMNEVAALVGDTSTWKDKKIGLFYQINTLRRNLMHVVRDAVGREDHQKAAAIDDYLQGSYNRHEAMLNREATRIKDPYKKLKITKAEDAYIQMLGELRHNPDSELLPDNVEEFYQANKDHIDKDKVNKIIEMSRQTYDDLLKRVNEVLRAQGMKEIPYRKGYFPHFTEDKQTWFTKLINWKVNKNKIPTNIAGLTETYQPERSWQRFNKQRMSDTTDYSFTKGMDTYVQGALDWIYHIEDIQKRRAFENYLRYVHSDKGVQERIDKIFASNEYDATEAQQQIDLILKEKENPLGNFVTDLRTGTNLLAGKKHSKDRNMEMDWNREVYSTMTNINNRVSADMVAGSISAAISNFIPITQSWSQVSPKSTLKAMGQAFSNILWDDGTVDKSAFLTNRLRKAENLNKGAWDKISDKIGMLMEAADWFTSQTVWRSKYMENKKAGMEEDAAIQNADQFCRDLMADRSRGNMPTIFEAKNIKTRMLTAFQLEVANQYGYMFRDLPQAMQEKGKGELVKGYVTMFIGAYAYNALSSAITGRAQAFDPIRIIEELLADLGVQGTTQLLFGGEEEEEDEVDPWGAIKGLVKNVIQEVPFVGGIMGGGRVPISSALPYDGNLMDIMSGIEKLSERDFSDITTEWMNPVYYLFLPMAGGQLRKIFQGLDMYGVFDGLTGQDHTVPGSYTGSGDLRFPVETGFLPVMQNVLFGQWSSENAQQYIDEGRSPLSEKQTQEFFDLGVSIQEYWDYLDGLKKLNKQSETGRASLNQQGDYIAGLDLTVEQKNLLINNLADRKEPIDMSTYDDYPNFEEFDYGTKNPDKYAVARAVGGYERYKEYREDLSDIREDETVEDKEQAVLRYINDLDAEYGEKIILYVSEYPNKENRDTYGYEIVDYLNSRGDISYSEMERILTKLGFDVDAEGRVNWD